MTREQLVQKWNAEVLYHPDRDDLQLDRHFGLCHICRLRRRITYCSWCEHWLCGACRSAWYSRGVEAVKALIDFVSGRNRHAGLCCGPVEDMDAQA